MKVILILVLASVTSFEVYEAVYAAQKWNSYQDKTIVEKSNPCPDPQFIIQRVEYNPINDINIDSFLQVYGINPENINAKSNRKRLTTKAEMLIEPKKIVPDTPKFKIKVSKVK